MAKNFEQYLKEISKPHIKLTKLEFLQPDGSVAFSLGNTLSKDGHNSLYDTKCLIQAGTLNVTLQNGIRRKASINLINKDSAFDYAVNKIWYGRQVRLSMGIQLADGTEFYLPQGVFYITSPKATHKQNEKTITYELTDKWAYLDGSLFGNLAALHQVNGGAGTNTNIFDAMQSILKWNRYDMDGNEATDELKMLDNVKPVFTDFYNGKTTTYTDIDGTTYTMPLTSVFYTITSESTAANIILELNDMIAGIIGYDVTGALRVEASDDDISDSDKAVLWDFSLSDSNFFSFTETTQNEKIYNDIIITGEGLNDESVWGRATNYDPNSNTNVDLIGMKTYRENKAGYTTTQQCVSLAKWYLKRKTVLKNQITITCGQLYHLQENGLISVKRTDKPNSPIERHVIQSFSIPLGQGSMTIQAVSVNDDPAITITSSESNY